MCFKNLHIPMPIKSYIRIKKTKYQLIQQNKITKLRKKLNFIIHNQDYKQDLKVPSMQNVKEQTFRIFL